jgi:hypothetical protein
VRKIIALTAAAGLLVTLAACSTSAPSGDCTPTVLPGDASGIVTAGGAFGSEPAATFPTPIVSTGVEATELTTGSGATVFEGQYAETQVTLYDGESGEYLTSTSYESTGGFTVRAGEGAGNIGQALECRTVGSRVAVAANGSDLYGFANITEETVKPGASFVVVFDIQGVVLGKAYGVDQPAQQGMPSVVTTPDGVPGVTVPGEDPPAGLRVAVLKQADGATLAEGDSIYVHYLRVDWADPHSIASTKSTWTDFGSPEIMTLSPLDASTGVGLTSGLLQALVGQKAGSQVLVVVPPSFGFPDGATVPEGVDPASTLVYVVDILGVVD